MYKVIDRQGTGAMSGRIFASKEDARDQLASFHSVDVENTETMTLEDLCEIGDWELVEADYTDIIDALDDMDDDSDTPKLEAAMNYFCSAWDIREGMKHAIAMTLRDQYENHPEDQESGDLEKLWELVK